MAYQVTDSCINCGGCVSECPNNAIYEGGMKWSIAKGTKVKGQFTLHDGTIVEAEQRYPALEEDNSYIVMSKCTECVGFYDKPQCIEACSVDAIIKYDLYIETEEQLLAKKELLHKVA